MALLNDGDVIFRVQLLLDIVHKSASAGPAYAKWAQLAQDELHDIYLSLAPAPASEPELPLEETHDNG